MAKKEIFIGSSSESINTAKIIAQTLSKAGLKPCRWWEGFSVGEYTIDQLLEIAIRVDGAVFLCTADDKTWFRGKETDEPRDNCVLEYGIFVAKIGRSRTYLLADPKVKLPSDMHGVTFASLSEDDVATAAEEAAAHFNKLFKDSPQKTAFVHFVADPSVLDARIEGPAPHWLSRSLYLGDEGASNWLAVVNEPEYPNRKGQYSVKKNRLEAISCVDVRTLVSFGPGDAEQDGPIISMLINKEPLLEYIPIDICNSLLEHTVKALRYNVTIPIAIVADFEDGHAFISTQLRAFGKHPTLFALLGGTMGNLDKGELSFLTKTKAMMETGDWLLLDIALAGSNWNPEDEPRMHHESYTAANRRFLAAGIYKRQAESPDALVDAFDERFDFKLDIVNGSDVPKTATIRTFDVTNEQTILLNRRYNWDSFLKMLKDQVEFKVEFEASSYDEKEQFGMGVVLVRKE